MTLYLLVFLVIIVVPIGTTVHELGHGAVALIMRADAVALHIGIGKHVKTYGLGRLSIHIHAVFFIGGLAKSERAHSYNTREKIWIALGGPLCNAILVILFIILLYPTHNPYIQLFVLFQAWMMFINVIPFKWNGKKSDGYTIIQTFSERNTNDTTNK